MKLEDIKKILILGSGTMGQQISIPCALHGFDVTLYDISQEALDRALKRIRRMLDEFVTWKRATAEEADAAFARISATTDPAAAAAEADLLSESIPEDPDLKGKVLGQFNSLCPARTVFTTNTSTLLPSQFAAASGRSERLVALHFHDIRITDVVDVMPHPGSSPEVMALVTDFAIRIGQAPIVMRRESSGYVFNFMIGALFLSAQTLAVNDVAAVEDIDRAWMGVSRMMIGPFGLMDSVGLDTVWKITDYWARRKKDPLTQKCADYLKAYVDRGTLGQKTKKGFYEYPKPRYAEADFLKKNLG